MKTISIPSATRPNMRDINGRIAPQAPVHSTMLKGIARNVTAVPEDLIRNRVKLEIKEELLTEGVDHKGSCPFFRYHSAHLVCVGQLDGEGIPDSC